MASRLPKRGVHTSWKDVYRASNLGKFLCSLALHDDVEQ